MADVQAILNALTVFSGAPDKASIEQANSFLQDFQHSPGAWGTANLLLLSPSAPPPAKLFAAQTFRTKVIYDLSQVAASDLPSLRDTLLAALQAYHAGPRSIIIQLSLAIAGLALQFPAWSNPIPSIIDSFGQNPATVPPLLQFLTLLPEEVNNSRIPITDEEWNSRAPTLLGDNSKQILDLLAIYMQASGVTSEVQIQVFNCLNNWLYHGEITAEAIAATPLLQFAFEALGSDQLFDSAVDVICGIIHETQEIEDNMPIIELIVPRVTALKTSLVKDHDDIDKIKGYAKILTEAGETYRGLILQHPEAFFPIVEAIGECSAYPDLDIVPITFPFWERLAQTMGKRSSIAPPLLEAYRNLLHVVVRHLQFPPDSSPMMGQEAEDFRSFRHVMGDTLKDCCVVLRTDVCLLATYDLVAAALSGGPNVSWQDVEAPLFAMRSMGAEVDKSDDAAVPKIMDLIPSLPVHPKVRYAAILIISRYSEWINTHPEYLQTQLAYISSGFELGDSEVSAAAGQALKYLCRDCKSHLVDFLPTLHTFLNTTGIQLPQDIKIEVYEAISHVISAMPMERAGEALKTFSLDILNMLHTVTGKPIATKQDLLDVTNGLENLEMMLSTIKGFGNKLPSACQNSCPETWSVIDNLLLKYGSDYGIAERANRVVRYGIGMYGKAGLPIAPRVVARMSFAFEATGISSYLWIAGKIMERFGFETGEDLHGSFREVYERSTNKMLTLLTEKTPIGIPDVLDDYLHMVKQLTDTDTNTFFQSSAFPLALRVATAALTVTQTEQPATIALDIFVAVVGHDCLLPNSDNDLAAIYAPWATSIRTVIDSEGFNIAGYLLSGLVGDLGSENTNEIISIFRSLAGVFPVQFMSWLPGLLHQLPVAVIPNETKTQVLSDITNHMNANQPDKVKYAILQLQRTARQTKERRRTTGLK